MDLRYMEAFIKVCDLRGFTAAATALGISQPGVSKQIQRLEITLGTELLHRADNGIHLTETGRLAYHSGKTLLAEWTRLVESCHPSAGILSGTLRIGCSSIPAKHLLPSRIVSFHRQHPKVELCVEVANSHEVLQSLQHGDVDIAFVGTQPHAPEIFAAGLASDKLVIIANFPFEGEFNWQDYPFILRQSGSGTRDATEEALSNIGIVLNHVRCVAEVNNTEVMLEMVQAGMGLAIVSQWDASQAVRAQRVRIVHELPIEQKFYLACHREKRTSELIHAFIEIAQN